jgi:hypothetical protein
MSIRDILTSMDRLFQHLTTGLVRAVAKDGSVWWVTPDHVPTVEARDAALVPGLSDDGGYAALMGPKGAPR